MKFNIKKITSVIAGAIMLSSTIGFAAAVSYPQPFVSSGAEDGAIVYGAAADLSDFAAAVNIQTKLNALVSGTGTSTVSGGDSVELWRSSDKLNIRDSASDVFVTSIDDDNMPTLLAEGTYKDDNSDEFDFTQKIELGNNLNLSHFSDSDYKEKTPTLGIHLDSDDHVLNYTMDFTTNPGWDNALETTDMTLLGRTYFVLDQTNTSDCSHSSCKLTLLDSATTTIVSEGETTTLNVEGTSYEISVEYIGSSETKLNIDGEITNSLAEKATYKLSDGSYVGIKDIMYVSKDTGISKVEFSIGSGKLEVQHNTEVELNDVDVDGLKGFIHASSHALDKIVLEWKTEDEEFIVPDQELVLPGFESLKLSLPEIVKPLEEEIKVGWSDKNIELTVPIKDGTANFDILQVNSSGEITLIGKDSSHRLCTSNNTRIHFHAGVDELFVASWNGTSEAESYLLKVTKGSIDNDGTNSRVSITNVLKGTDACTTKTAGETCSIGSVILTIDNVSDSANTVNISINSAGGSFNRIYSKEGLAIYLPWYNDNITTNTYGAINTSNSTLEIQTANYVPFDGGSAAILYDLAGYGYGSWYLWAAEENKDGSLGVGTKFNITIDETSSEVHVSGVNSGQTEYEVGETDVYETYTWGDVSTKILYDTGGTRDDAKIIYHGDQVYGNLYIASPETSIIPGGGTSGGQVLVVKDTEIDSVKDKNLIVIGGSCINTAAAGILGLTYPACEAAFTAATNVGAGQYIIKTIASPYAAADSGKVAMLVAGYNAADTTTAVNKAADGVTSDIDTEQVYPITSA